MYCALGFDNMTFWTLKRKYLLISLFMFILYTSLHFYSTIKSGRLDLYVSSSVTFDDRGQVISLFLLFLVTTRGNVKYSLTYWLLRYVETNTCVLSLSFICVESETECLSDTKQHLWMNIEATLLTHQGRHFCRRLVKKLDLDSKEKNLISCQVP